MKSKINNPIAMDFQEFMNSIMTFPTTFALKDPNLYLLGGNRLFQMDRPQATYFAETVKDTIEKIGDHLASKMNPLKGINDSSFACLC
jgi:hypothetical protein